MPWRVVLRRLPGAAAGLGVLALSLAGCGQSSDSHQSLAAYVVRVNKLEAQLTPPLLVVSKAGREIGAQGPAPGPGTGLLSGGLVVNEEHARLLRAAETIHRLQRKLGAIPAPAGAQHLRALLLALMGDQESLTRQTAKLVIFLPGFRAALAPLAPAIRKLEAALTVNKASGPAAVAGVYQGKAAALRTFEGTVNGILAGVRRLDPPDVSVPQDRIEVRSLEGMSTAAGQLAPALAHGGQGTSQLLAQFDRAASSTTTRAAQQVQADAVKAYDARIAQLNQLAEAASRERARLVNPRRQAAR